MDTPWRDELVDLARAASGGLVFGVPLLYTMEIWWVGSHTQPETLLLLLGFLFVPIVALMMTSGFRTAREIRVRDAVGDAIEALAIGLVVTTLVLVVLRQITLDTPSIVGLGRVVHECIPFCLGVAVARFLLQGDPSVAEDDSSDAPDVRTLNSNVADVGAAALGAAFISLSIAPTDEVPMLASTMAPGWQLLVMGASITISYVIVFVAGFTGQDRRHRQRGVFQHPVTETLVSYLVGLIVAALLLTVFQRSGSPAPAFVAHVVVLGLPAAVGGAIGRLAI